jgi:N-acetylneuraminic acid mutarotase
LKFNLNNRKARLMTRAFTFFLGLLMAIPLVAAAQPQSYPALPEALSSFGGIAADGFLYVYGGHTGKAHNYSTATVSGKFHRLDLKAPKAWEELPGGPPLQGMNLAAHAGKIYRVGGMQPRNAPGEAADNHSVADVACYDPAAKQWTTLPPMPEPRSSHDVVALNGKLYVVGGWTMKGREQKPTWLKTVLALDLSAPNMKWTALEQPFQRRALCVGAAGGKLYVLGGMNEKGAITKQVDVLDPKTMKWSKSAALPGDEGNGFSPAACTMGRLCVTVGDGGVFRLDAKGAAWERIGGVDVGRIVARLVSGGPGRLLVVGGSGAKGNVAEIGVVDFQ